MIKIIKILILLPSYLFRVLFFNEKIIRLLYAYPYTNKHHGKKFLSFTFRDKVPFISNIVDFRYEDYGIVIQGPIEMAGDFTFNTINYYLKQFPGIKVVLSTWNHKKLNRFERIENLIILNNSMLSTNLDNDLDFSTNMNYQILSTYNGLAVLKGEGVRFAIKTRTDVRLYDAKLFVNLSNLSIVFDGDRKSRIILIDHNSLINVDFHLDDTFQYGEIDELIKFWNIPLIKKKNCEYLILRNKLNLKFGVQAYLFIHYIHKIDGNISLNFNSYLDNAVKHFVIIPKEIIGVFWFKYQKKENFSKKSFYDSEFSNRVSFSDWLESEINESHYSFNKSCEE